MLTFAAARWHLPCRIDNGSIALPEEFHDVIDGPPEVQVELIGDCFEEQLEPEDAADIVDDDDA